MLLSTIDKMATCYSDLRYRRHVRRLLMKVSYEDKSLCQPYVTYRQQSLVNDIWSVDWCSAILHLLAVIVIVRICFSHRAWQLYVNWEVIYLLLRLVTAVFVYSYVWLPLWHCGPRQVSNTVYLT